MVFFHAVIGELNILVSLVLWEVKCMGEKHDCFFFLFSLHAVSFHTYTEQKYGYMYLFAMLQTIICSKYIAVALLQALAMLSTFNRLQCVRYLYHSEINVPKAVRMPIMNITFKGVCCVFL